MQAKKKMWIILKINLTFISFLSLINCQSDTYSQVNRDNDIVDYILISQDILGAIRNGQNPSLFQKKIENSTLEELQNQLQSDQQKLVFWINIYNAYIQILLNENPDLYEKRTAFFEKARIQIAGRMMSFNNIEHGIIRGSQWAYGFGRIKNPFAPSYQRKLRISEREPRVHFALNCGAKSCPPVAILRLETLDEQFNRLTATFLSKFSDYDETKNTVTTTPLFSWFRGDFGGKKGIKKMLKEYGVVPSEEVSLNFDSYDWTLDLGNFIED